MQTETLIRKTFPKIRRVEIKGLPFFQVDARRRGTSGKRETFAVQSKAEDRARAIALEFAANGVEGLAMPATLRAWAFAGERILAPFGKTIMEACEFYRDHLEGQKKKDESALISVLAPAWHKDKASGKTKKLRATTLKDIKETSELLTNSFGSKRILEISKADIEAHLDGCKVGLQRKFNLNSRFSQFFNWAISKEHCASNPCDKIEIEVNSKDISIFTAEEAKRVLQVCEEQFPEYVLYHAISLFAGLRPEECQALKWENVHIAEKTIHVLAETSKIKESRNVHVEDNLLSWLKQHAPNNAKGFVTPQEAFKKRSLKIHVALGFKGSGKNPKAQPWAQDIMRHSFGSYWLAKHKNRATLAEEMGNSIKIIKKHYKKVVTKTECEAYWKILPKGFGEAVSQRVRNKFGRKPQEALASVSE